MWSFELGEGDQNSKILLFFICLFALVISGMTVIAVIDQTALNEQYVNDTFDKEGVHQEMSFALQENLVGQIENNTANSEEMASKIITEEFAATELRRNINESVAYLRGDESTMDLAMNYKPVRLSLLEMTDPGAHDAINESVPPEVNIEIDPEESGLADARLFTSRFQTALVSFAFFAVLAAGAITYLTPSYRDTAKYLGLGLLIASVLEFIMGVVLLLVGRELTISTTGEVRIDPEILFEGILAVVEGIGVTVLTYSAILLFFSLALLAFGRSGKTQDLYITVSESGISDSLQQNTREEGDQTNATEEVTQQQDETNDQGAVISSTSDNTTGR